MFWITIAVEATTLILQTLSVSLAWRIGSADRSYRFLAASLALMAFRRATAIMISAERASSEQAPSWKEIADRVTLPMLITVGVTHFLLMQTRRISMRTETHPEGGARAWWSTTSIPMPPKTRDTDKP